MKHNEYIHGIGVVKFDFKKVKINWSNMFIILYMMTTGIAGVIGTYMYFKIDKRVDIVELYKGPSTPTEWAVSRGKIFIPQSAYTIHISINGWQIAP